MFLDFLLLGLGLAGLWLGSGLIIDSGKAIAHRLGVSGLLIGLTIVSIGTSLPEIMVSVFSGIDGAPSLAVGAIVGSCLTQTTLVLGVAGLIHNIHANEKALKIDGMMMLIAAVLFWLVVYTGDGVTRIEAAGLIAVYIGYLVYTTKHDKLTEQAEELADHEKKGLPLWLRFLILCGGIGVLIFSADVVLDKSLVLADFYGVTESFVGVMIVGVATCLPELSTAVAGAVKKAPGLAIGALIGSNITDPLLSMSSGALINGFEVSNGLLMFDIPYWILASVLALLLLFRKKLTLFRGEALVLVLVYAVFVGVKVFA